MDAVDRLDKALHEAGLSIPDQAYGESVIGGLESELIPLRVPVMLRDLWARMAVGRVPLGPSMRVARAFTTWFSDLSLTWWLWRAIRDRPGLMPEALLPVVWYGEVMQLIELGGDGHRSGDR